jgi:hypothetical protein
MLYLQITACPETGCGLPAEIIDRFVLQSTDGPVEHVRTHCLGRHIFTVPTARLRPVDRAPDTSTIRWAGSRSQPA